jgi:hypothetical protein
MQVFVGFWDPRGWNDFQTGAKPFPTAGKAYGPVKTTICNDRRIIYAENIVKLPGANSHRVAVCSRLVLLAAGGKSFRISECH